MAWDIFRLGRLEEAVLNLDLHSLAHVAVLLHKAWLLMKDNGLNLCCIYLNVTYLYLPCEGLSSQHLCVLVWLRFWGPRA